MKKKILVTALIVILSAVAYSFYLFNKPHQSISGSKPEFSLSSIDLIHEFEANEESANKKYLGKVIEVTGTVAEKSIDDKGILNITLRGSDLAGIGCQFEKNSIQRAKTIQDGHTVRIKGICTGILIDVVLVDCVIEAENI